MAFRHHCEVLKAHVRTIVAPAAKYMNEKVIGEAGRGAVIERMAIARMFDPRHVKSSGLTDAQIGELRAFRFVNTMDEYGELLNKMKDERSKYVGLANSITNETLRINPSTGKDTFDLLAFWRGHKEDIPSFAKMCRAVLSYAPNSCPPERVFSILADSFGDDQRSAMADYMEWSMMIQFNSRTRP